jgi:hypothetical protein
MEKSNLVSQGNEFGFKIHGSQVFTPELLWSEGHSAGSPKKPEVDFQNNQNHLLKWAPLISQSWS